MQSRIKPSSIFLWERDDLFGGYDDGMVGMVEDANVLLGDETSYPPRSDDRDDVVDLAEEIDYYLNYWNEHGL